jgi:hypothetical protein
MGSPRLRPFKVEAVIDFGATRTGQLFLRRANDLADSQEVAKLSDIEDRFVCTACGKRGADVRPNFSEGKKSLGY